MPYLIALFFTAVMLVGGALFVLVSPDTPGATMKLGGMTSPVSTQRSGTQKSDPLAVRQDVASPEQDEASPFDIAKISTDGTSVFAGRAAPNLVVTVFADGVPIGSADTDENGEWVLLTERRSANANPKLSIKVGARVQPAADVARTGNKGVKTASLSSQLIDDLRVRVERARDDEERRRTEPNAASRGTALQEIVPVPINFVFRESEFTDEGRKAAQLLLDYLLLEKPVSLKMTGHADERGSHDFNMKLSAERLETVSKFLRSGGYTGKLVLVPKGDQEPFTGVDRARFPREQLYDLDRRVELHIDR